MIPTSPIYAQRITKRAQDAARRISEKPTSVVFRTPGPQRAFLPAQILRLEWDNRASTITSTAGTAPRMGLIVYGVRGHPSIPDSDMKENYTFKYLGDDYAILDIILQLGEIQGIAVAT